MTDSSTHITATTAPSSPSGPPSVWFTLRYPDPQAAVDLLVSTLGFEPTTLIPDGAGGYAHIELRWPEGSGGVMIGTSDEPMPGWPYVVTADPDRIYRQATAAGLTIVEELHETEYGSRTFTVVDPWSVRWTFGTYSGQ